MPLPQDRQRAVACSRTEPIPSSTLTILVTTTIVKTHLVGERLGASCSVGRSAPIRNRSGPVQRAALLINLTSTCWLRFVDSLRHLFTNNPSLEKHVYASTTSVPALGLLTSRHARLVHPRDVAQRLPIVGQPEVTCENSSFPLAGHPGVGGGLHKAMTLSLLIESESLGQPITSAVSRPVMCSSRV